MDVTIDYSANLSMSDLVKIVDELKITPKMLAAEYDPGNGDTPMEICLMVVVQDRCYDEVTRRVQHDLGTTLPSSY